MATQIQDHVTGARLIVVKQRIQRQYPDFCCLESENRNLITSSGMVESTTEKNNRIGRKADVFAVANSVREHVKLSPKLSEAVKGKLSLGARILQTGGMRKVFKYLFSVGEKERLIKASQCYLSTTAGPIAGILFISTEKVGFCSDRKIKLSCPGRKSLWVHYKAAIPLVKIQMVNQSENDQLRSTSR